MQSAPQVDHSNQGDQAPSIAGDRKKEILQSRIILCVRLILVERVTELKVLGVVLDSKLLFEGHISSIAVSASSKHGIMRKALCLFGDPVFVMFVW